MISVNTQQSVVVEGVLLHSGLSNPRSRFPFTRNWSIIKLSIINEVDSFPQAGQTVPSSQILTQMNSDLIHLAVDAERARAGM